MVVTGGVFDRNWCNRCANAVTSAVDQSWSWSCTCARRSRSASARTPTPASVSVSGRPWVRHGSGLHQDPSSVGALTQLTRHGGTVHPEGIRDVGCTATGVARDVPQHRVLGKSRQSAGRTVTGHQLTDQVHELLVHRSDSPTSIVLHHATITPRSRRSSARIRTEASARADEPCRRSPDGDAQQLPDVVDADRATEHLPLVHDRVEEFAFAVLQRNNFLFDGSRRHQPVHRKPRRRQGRISSRAMS